MADRPAGEGVSMDQRLLARPPARAALLTGLGLSLAMLVRAWPPVGLRGSVLLTAVTIGAALSAGTVGVRRLAGRGLDLRWFGIGILAGTGWLVLT